MSAWCSTQVATEDRELCPPASSLDQQQQQQKETDQMFALLWPHPLPASRHSWGLGLSGNPSYKFGVARAEQQLRGLSRKLQLDELHWAVSSFGDRWV